MTHVTLEDHDTGTTTRTRIEADRGRIHCPELGVFDSRADALAAIARWHATRVSDRGEVDDDRLPTRCCWGLSEW